MKSIKNKISINKKIILITVLIILSIVSIIIVFNCFKKPSFKYLEKYNMSISIDLLDNESNHSRVNYIVKYDGKNALVYNDLYFKQGVYILQKPDSYNFVNKENRKYMIYTSDYSILDIYPTFKEIDYFKDTYSDESKEVYDIKIKKNIINSIFDYLFLEADVTKDCNGSIIVKNDYIKSLSFLLYDVEKYKQVNFIISIDELENHFQVQVPLLEFDKREITDENIFDIFN